MAEYNLKVRERQKRHKKKVNQVKGQSNKASFEDFGLVDICLPEPRLHAQICPGRGMPRQLLPTCQAAAKSPKPAPIWAVDLCPLERY